MNLDPRSVIERARHAINAHDLDALVDCFAEDYQGEQPSHPGWGITDHAQVRRNWAGIFSSVPDIQAEILRTAVESDVVWVEWRWFGTRTDRTPHDMRAITIFGVRGDQISWGRLYIEVVQP